MAAARAKLITPPFEALYAHIAGSPKRPDTEPVTTIDPPPDARIAGITARTPRITPRRFTVIARSTSSIGWSSSEPLEATAALSTAPSR